MRLPSTGAPVLWTRAYKCPILATFLHINFNVTPSKHKGSDLAIDLYPSSVSFLEIAVIVIVLLAAVLILVAVTLISSIDFSNSRRHYFLPPPFITRRQSHRFAAGCTLALPASAWTSA